MAQRIRVRSISTVGFVDKGDDPEASVELLKRREEEPVETPEMTTYQKVMKAVGAVLGLDAETAISEVDPNIEEEGRMAEYKREDLPQEAQDEIKRLEDLNAEIQAKLDAVPAPVEVEVETPVEIPDAVAKRLDDAEKRASEAEQKIAKLESEKRAALFLTKAQQFKHLPEFTADDFGSILAKIDEALEPAEFERLEKVLRGANEAVRQSVLLKEIGSGSGYGSKAAEVKAEVEKIRATDSTLSPEQAERKVFKDNPALYAAVQDEIANQKVKG